MAKVRKEGIVPRIKFAETLGEWKRELHEAGCPESTIVYSAHARHDLAGDPIEAVMVGENNDAPA